ncbi:MAG: gamma-glutamylcyclotransferase family protein [Nanoarchaeota archaeon]
MTKKVLYFGYGANKNPEMIAAIIGRKPCGFPAKLFNYGLFIQSWKDIPVKARKILRETSSFEEGFKSYCISPSKGKSTQGMVWTITRLERQLIGAWELHGVWYKPIVVDVTTLNGKIIKNVETEVIRSKEIKQFMLGNRYKAFPNDQRIMLMEARKTREEFLLNLEGS